MKQKICTDIFHVVVHSYVDCPQSCKHRRNKAKGEMLLASPHPHLLSHQVTIYVYGFGYVAMLSIINLTAETWCTCPTDELILWVGRASVV